VPSAGAGFRYVSFLVRLWRDSADNTSPVRISAESVQSGAIVEMDDLSALLSHLQAAWAEAADSPSGQDVTEDRANFGRDAPCTT
jgi:hypothetical protein